MQQVVVFSSGCQACTDVAEILRKQGAEPEIVDLQANEPLRKEVSAFLEAHGKEATFPQVVVGGRMFIGGIDRVKELEASGRLGEILATPQEKKGGCCRSLPEDQCNNMHRGMGKKGAEEAHSHDHAHDHEEEKEHAH